MPYRQELVTLGNGLAGYVPVPRYCAILHDCQNTMGVVSVSGCTVSLNTDTRFTRPGKPRSVKLTASSTSMDFKVALGGATSGAMDMRGAGDVTIWLWCPWVRGTSTLTIDLCSQPDRANKSARWTFYLYPGLNRCVLRRADPTASGNTTAQTQPGANPVDWSTVALIYCSMSGTTSGDVAYVCGIDVGRKAKAILINTCDDNRSSIAQIWQGLLDARGIHATAYLIGSKLDTSTYWTSAEADAWHAAGHDISYHSYGDLLPTTNSLSVDTMKADIDSHLALANRKGWVRRGEHRYMGYNGGEDSANFLAALASRNFRTGRLASSNNPGGCCPEQYMQPGLASYPSSTSSNYGGGYMGVPGYLVAHAGTGGQTVTTLYAQIDQAVEHGLVQQYVWHVVQGVADPANLSDPTVSVTTTQAGQILDYMMKYKRAGMAEVLSMTEAMSLLGSEFAPAITKTNPATVPGIQMAFDVQSGYDASLISLTGTTVNSFTSQDANAYSFAPGASLTKPTISQATNNGKTFRTILHSSSLDTDGLYATFSVPQPCHIMIVARFTALEAQDQFFFDGIGASNRNALLKQQSSVSYFALAGTNITATYTNDTTYWTPDTNWHIVEFVANGAQSKIFVDGAFLSADGGTQTLTGLTIGNRYQGGGTVRGRSFEWAACYVFKTDHTYSGYDYQMRAYLADRFGITLISDGRQ